MSGTLPSTCIATVLLFAVGCGDSGPKKYSVSGDVKWEGQPIESGDIVLTPTDGGVPDAGKIVAGQYQLDATAGPKKVSIIATREVGEVDPEMGMARRESYIPVRYNDETKLTAEVTPAGPNQFDFTLPEGE